MDPFMTALGFQGEVSAPGEARVWVGSGRNTSTVGARPTAA